MLSQHTWRRLDELFHQAQALPEASRATFAQQHAGDDPALLQTLLAMLAASPDATRVLGGPLNEISGLLATEAQPPDLPAGTRLGPWAILRTLGAGGMGKVYLAERADGAYQRQVAIKLIAARASSERMRGSFEYECRLLAQMQHPAIAQIQDAGTNAEGHPYLVMEYIQGAPLTAWCDSQALPLRQRIELLVKVAEGVQHAHQKGVIHRDLKPANILVSEVDGQPMPKIIDFGIAAELDQRRVDAHGGTPGYMSPEQARADGEVDARSDVYALGAMLHELICGQRPAPDGDPSPSRRFNALPDAERRAVATKRRTSPPHLLQACDDGLDAIALMALQPDPTARQVSVSALIDDLRRWLGHYPVLAADNSRIRSLRLFVRRNRLAVASTAALLAVLVAGLGATAWSLHQAREEAARARITANFLSGILDSVDPAVSQDLDKTLMLRVMDQASARASHDLAAFPDIQADMELLIAINLITLAEDEQAIPHLESIRTLALRYPGKLEFQRLRALQVLGNALSNVNRDSEAKVVLEEGIRRAEHGKPEYRWLAEDMRSRLAGALFSLGQAQQAQQLARSSFEALSRLMPADDQQRLDAEKRYASILGFSGQQEQAEPLYRDLVQRRMRLNGPDHPLTLFARKEMSILYLQQRKFALAEAELRPILASAQRQYGKDSEMATTIGGLLGSALREQGKVADAGPYYQAVRDFNVAKYGPDAASSLVARHNHANWLLADGQAEAAEREQAELLKASKSRLGNTNEVTAQILRGLAEAELALGNLPAAQTHAEEGLSVMQALYGKVNDEAQRDFRDTLARIAASPSSTTGTTAVAGR